MVRKILTLIASFLIISCLSEQPDAIVSIDVNTIINESYIGNGVQWDPYQLDYGNGELEISEADWQKLYARLDFMRPQFIRIMINTSSFITEDGLAPEKRMKTLRRILDYCQSRSVAVMFGDWGWSVINTRKADVDNKNMAYAAELLNYLVEEQGYTCIKHYNLINEPNGYWAATKGSFSLWALSVKRFYAEMERLHLTGKVSLVGPDVAIWSEKEAWWIDSTAIYLGDVIGLYDIHTYPSKITVNSGKYASIIKAYKQRVPDSRKIVMGEIGFKFVEEADSLYNRENVHRARSKKHASLEDSQMYVYDYMYGTDMADALFQTISSGYSGSVVWMLDDAMHSNEAPDKLKVWGFWNILGEEYFGAEEEAVRPWYYAWSLLSKYMPAGSKIYGIDVVGDKGIKAVVSGKEGKYMLGIVNVSKQTKRVNIKSASMGTLTDCKAFLYSRTTLNTQGDYLLLPNEQGLTLNLSLGEECLLPSESLIVYTNFDY